MADDTDGAVHILRALYSREREQLLSAEKANTVRRIMEFVLKVECCADGLALKKNYSQALPGDGKAAPLACNLLYDVA